jgi:hypothetical protein
MSKGDWIAGFMSILLVAAYYFRIDILFGALLFFFYVLTAYTFDKEIEKREKQNKNKR